MSKLEDNSIVNLLTMEQLCTIVRTIFCGWYEQGRGKRRAQAVDYRIPYVVVSDGLYIINPYACSWTKGFKEGYATIPFKLSAGQQMYAPKSTTAKSTWVPRVLIHAAVWRWWNGGKPVRYQVSHLRGCRFNITPWELYDEEGFVNRSRVACHQLGWYAERRCTQHVRCPHEPRCLEPTPSIPGDAVFLLRDAEAPGLPKRDQEGRGNPFVRPSLVHPHQSELSDGAELVLGNTPGCGNPEICSLASDSDATPLLPSSPRPHKRDRGTAANTLTQWLSEYPSSSPKRTRLMAEPKGKQRNVRR